MPTYEQALEAMEIAYQRGDVESAIEMAAYAKELQSQAGLESQPEPASVLDQLSGGVKATTKGLIQDVAFFPNMIADVGVNAYNRITGNQMPTYSSRFPEMLDQYLPSPGYENVEKAAELAGAFVSLPLLARKAAGLLTKTPDEAERFAVELYRRNRAMAPSKLTAKAIRAAGKRLYEQARSAGVELKAESLDSLREAITNKLVDMGVRDFTHPKIYKALDELRAPQGSYKASLDDLTSVRKVLSNIKGEEAMRANQVKHEIFKFLDNINPSDLISSSVDEAQKAVSSLKEATANWAAYRRGKTLQDARTSSERRLAATGSNAVESSARVKMNQILEDEALRRQYSPTELEEIDKIVRGSKATNVFRSVGKLAPSNSEKFMAAAVTAPHIPLVYPVAAIGYGAKKIAETMTKRRIAKLEQETLRRSPEGAEFARRTPGYE